MNILIISYHFYPSNKIASFRINAFAKYFAKAGHSVTVIAEGERDEMVEWNGCLVHYVANPIITESKLYEYVRANKRWRIRRILSSLEWRATYDKFFWQLKAYKKAKRLFHRNFDIVLSSCEPISPHKIALKLKRDGYKFFWVADIRDELSKHPFRSEYRRRWLEPFERKVFENADLVTSVSKPIIEDFKSMCNHDRFLEIKNGYDYEEYKEVNFQPQFTMAYIGNFYLEITPHKFFNAFAELIKEKRLPSDSLIKIVGSGLNYKEPDEIADNVITVPRVSHDEAIRMSVMETDVLFLMHPSCRRGVYSGKVFDYLASNKPILALYDPNDVVGALIAETKSGFVVDESDHEGIKEAIMKCYSIWKNKEVLPRDWDKIRQYRRENQTRILLDYLSAVLKK